MQEVFSKIIEELEEKRRRYFLTIANTGDEKLDCAYEYVGDALDKAIKIVKQAAGQYNNGWVPCSERLPEDKQTCLVTARIYFTPDHVDEIDNYIGVGIDTYSKQFGWLGTEPIAWQPLPAPYQPKGE